MNKTPSFQDLLGEFSKEVFVGRSEQLSLFEKGLTAPRPPFLILAISGQGGVGKTTLLEQFRYIAKDRGALIALTNEDQSSVSENLAAFAQQFESAGFPFEQFKERYQKYRELKQEVEADPSAPTGLFDFAVRSAARIGLRSLKRVPIAGDAADVLLSPGAEDRIADEASALTSYVAQKFRNREDRSLLLETKAALSRHFLHDLNECSGERRVVLFFDTFEKTGSYLETWLQELLDGKFGEFSSRVMFVIAGRYALGQTWTRFRRAVQQVELDKFTESEAREYLERCEITDEEKICELLKLSNRLPVLLAFLVSTPGEIPSDVSGTAVERFLQGASEEQKRAALAASAPRFFNYDVLEVILGRDAARSAFDWLSDAHFVRAGADG